MDRPDHREMKVLRGLCLGNVESAAYFAGVGQKTFERMIARGWIQEAYDTTYGVEGYRITELGNSVFDANA
jgi:hypothetical protein